MLRKLSAVRNRLRMLIYLGGSLWIFYILYFINSNFSNDKSAASNHSIYNVYDNYNYEDYQNKPGSQKDDANNTEGISEAVHFTNHTTFLSLADHFLHNETKLEDHTSDIYENIFKSHDLDTILGTLNFKQRCDLYFKNVFIDNVNWIFDLEYNYDVKTDGDDWKNWVEENKVTLKEKFAPKEKTLKKEDVEEWFRDFTKDEYLAYKIKYNEQQIINLVSLFRIFNKCYVTNDEVAQIDKVSSFVNTQRKLVHGMNPSIPGFSLNKAESLVDLLTASPATFENRVYPWISKQYPVYQRYTGKVHHQPPNFYKLLGDPVQKTKKNIKPSRESSEEPFMKRFKNKCNGRGLVLTIGDQHVEHTVHLIHLLRALDNRLPIQIVYYDDVSEDAKKKIVTAAQEDFKALPESFKKVSYMFGDLYLDTKGKGLPPQEIWFVNAYNSIQKNFRGKFARFGNKFLAAFFNSFDEFMLIDADTVMMKPPEYFFNLQGFIDTGTFFFRDRAVHKRSVDDGKLIERVSPNKIDTLMFDIPMMTNHTRNNDYFRGVQHFQESGLLLIDKNRHFSSLLMILEANVIQRLRKLSYGDKEVIWMGFAINGDEDYTFNKNAAGAIGELTPPDDRLRPDGTRHHSHEICANHPCHISGEDNHSLLWMNSGFRFCHQADEVDFEEEAKHKSRLKFLTSANAFRTFYHAPLRITHAIVPPLAPDLQDRKNADDEPGGGWLWEKNYCKKYMWCAYSSIGGRQKDETKPDNTIEGLIVSYSEEETNLFNYLGDIWIGTE
ncbi:putative alpha-1,3-mannosyltransferase MNN1 [Candida viswanathii]|uniref:Putative alpha-1,3-mannosyltransferase MNN1 n=1 Tax=Candida viswanathii TaxID=5486 RepID=A0A367YG54_9ASCO|nr:putative alpha-1,3-mannosyltransferase MNN1 [Candida viswanathii]